MKKLLAIISEVTAFALLAASMMFTVLEAKNRAWGVAGSSMEPTLYDGDILIGSNTRSYHHDDIIVFTDADGWSAKNNTNIVKRIIGVPGDVITVTIDGTVTVNGRHHADIHGEYAESCSNTGTFTVPKNTLFVMGDNSPVSDDSRYQFCNGYGNYLVHYDSIRIVVNQNWIIPLGKTIRTIF